MPPLLIPEPPLLFLPGLAVEIGLNEAIVVQRLYDRAATDSVDNGWVERGIAEWQEEDFPFLSRATVTRAFRKLVELGLVEVDDVRELGEVRRRRIRRGPGLDEVIG